jgi:signal transduction histidine kinase
MLDRALRAGEKAVAEGRQAIQDIRCSTELANDLARALQAVGDELACEGSPNFRVLVQGPSRDLHPILRDDVFGIAREAVRNAFRHAEAKSIDVEMDYGESLRVRVRDDGKGIDPAIVIEGRSSHYGIAGMRERAARIGGKLTVWSAPQGGTTIDLSIPGSKAYTASGGGSTQGFFRRRRAGA